MRDDARIMGNSPIRTMNRFSCETRISEALGEIILFSRVLVIIGGGREAAVEKQLQVLALRSRGLQVGRLIKHCNVT